MSSSTHNKSTGHKLPVCGPRGELNTKEALDCELTSATYHQHPPQVRQNGDEIDYPPEYAIPAPVSSRRWGIEFSPQICPRNERPNRRSKSTEAHLEYVVLSAVPSAVPCVAVRPSFCASSYASFPGFPQLRSLEAPRRFSQKGPRPSSP